LAFERHELVPDAIPLLRQATLRHRAVATFPFRLQLLLALGKVIVREPHRTLPRLREIFIHELVLEAVPHLLFTLGHFALRKTQPLFF
jgi:hypothetical protein